MVFYNSTYPITSISRPQSSFPCHPFLCLIPLDPHSLDHNVCPPSAQRQDAPRVGQPLSQQKALLVRGGCSRIQPMHFKKTACDSLSPPARAVQLKERVIKRRCAQLAVGARRLRRFNVQSSGGFKLQWLARIFTPIPLPPIPLTCFFGSWAFGNSTILPP
jgi:hypothetical protein